MPRPRKIADAIVKGIEKGAQAESAAQAVSAAQANLTRLKPSADELLDIENRQLENDKLEAEVEDLREKLAQERNLHGWRKGVLVALFGLIAVWLFLVIIYVALSAMSGPRTSETWALPFVFKLSDGVLIAFITSTTVSVIGLFLIAAKWLFAVKDSNHKEGKKGRL